MNILAKTLIIIAVNCKRLFYGRFFKNMKKQQFAIFSTIIFLAITIFYPSPTLASEYTELHCPKIIKVEDSMGNVGTDGISSSFIKGMVSTITVKITATDPQGLLLHYQFLFSDVVAGGRVDNQDEYGCIGAYYDTQAYLQYEIYPPETSCLSFTYSDWGACSESGQQTRSVMSSSPNGCTGGTPILNQSCTPTPKTCTSWTYSDWSSCQSNGAKTRSVVSSSPNGCVGGSPVLTQSCTYIPPTCTSWTYSNWSSCASNGQQTRTILTGSPSDCSGGSPVLSQSCTYTTPTTYCTNVFYSNWGTCIGGFQNRSVISSLPSGCTLTTAQQLATSKECVIHNKEVIDSNAPVKGDEEKKDIDKKDANQESALPGISKEGAELKNEVLQRERDSQATKFNTTLTNRLSGRILLQIEEKGEAWYVEPTTKAKHFMGRPADAFSMMREFGLGISENNFKNFVKDF